MENGAKHPFSTGPTVALIGRAVNPEHEIERRDGAFMMPLDLTSLREFGEAAERLDWAWPRIDVGGFIVPGRDSTPPPAPGKEEDEDEQREEPAPAQAGSAARARQRPAEAAPGAAAHALGRVALPAVTHRRDTLDLEELCRYYPSTTVAYSSSRFVGLTMSVGLFEGLPFRARLALEVPLVPRTELTRLPSVVVGRAGGETVVVGWLGDDLERRPVDFPIVPDVRAWATWEGSPWHGAVIRSHHQYPDLAICACMWPQFVLGVHPLSQYVDFCVLWIAKALHERELGFYPGTQHTSAKARVIRNRPDEYCGCADPRIGPRRYRDCHRTKDLGMTTFALWQDEQRGIRQYRDELAFQGRTPHPPEALVPRIARGPWRGDYLAPLVYEPLVRAGTPLSLTIHPG